MPQSAASVHTAVRLLREKEEQRKRRGAVVLRELATDVRNKESVCSSGGLELLLDLLETPCAEVTLVIATEVIALLVTENEDARVRAYLHTQQPVLLLLLVPSPHKTLHCFGSNLVVVQYSGFRK